MAPQQWDRIKAIFNSALDLPAAERDAYLARMCAGDPDLRNEVDRLLGENEGTPQPASSLAPGDLVAGRYRIKRMIGRGGMGEVYEVHDQLLNESVALKTLRADLARNETNAKRFQREIQLARKVTHPNVCRIFEAGMHELPGVGRPPLRFFTMELLNGEPLSARIRRGRRLSRAEAFPLVAQMAEGLQAAHKMGIVHADFKSGNVILIPAEEGDRAVITDFGLARIDPTTADPNETRTMGQAGNVIGTVAYMSPEQMAGGTLTTASDIYSFGIVLFEMATGKLPFDSGHLINAAMQRVSGDPVSARSLAPDIDPRWDSAIARCLQKEPERRFPSAEDLADWFRDGASRTPRPYWTRRDWIRAGVAVGIPTAAGGGYWMWSRRPYRPRPAALEWYTKGVAALHSMTYEAARKALEPAVASDPGFALAHASLARAYNELGYTERAKESMLTAMTAARQREDAERSLSKVKRLLDQNRNAQLQLTLTVHQAELAYQDGRLGDARALSRRALSSAPKGGAPAAERAKLIEALSLIRSRQPNGVELAGSVIEKFERDKLVFEAASARLAAAEAALAGGDRGSALKMAMEALDFFQPRRIQESIWRSRLVAARASRKSVDVEAHASAARSALIELKALWPPAQVEGYLRRPDIRLLSGGVRL